MTRFKTLADFENSFDNLTLEELRAWEKYWTQHAQFLAPKVKKEALKRVHQIRLAISSKAHEQPGSL